MPLRRKLHPRRINPVDVFTLIRQPGGEEANFDLYEEADLPYLDKSTEMGRMVSKNVI